MVEIKNRYTGEVILTVNAADLREADLRGADLSGANLDFSCWPLWCGTQGVTVDDPIRDQLALHLYWILGKGDPLKKALRNRARRAARKRNVSLRSV